MKKNDICTIEITDVISDGNGVGHIDGIAVFVPSLITGDVAEIKIVKVLKNYCYGILIKLIKKSDSRIESDCPVSGKCGGCSFRCMSYEKQLEMKKKIVSDAFLRIGKFNIKIDEIIGCENPERYRNKAQYPFAVEDGRIVCGFYSKRSHRVISHNDCRLHPQIFSEILKYTLELLNEKHFSVYNEKSNIGILRHFYIRQGYYSKETMVCFVVRKNISRELSYIVNKLTEKFSIIKSVILNINPDKTNVILGDKNILLYGKEYIKDSMCGLDFNISPLSFYQINTVQAEKLYGIAKRYASPMKSDTLIDFYCGTGTIGLSMADKAGRVIGVEIIEDAVKNAEINAVINKINNSEFICSDAGKAAEKIVSEKINADIITLDPPRKGCDNIMLDSLIKLSPEKIVMISCNPSTAARDCQWLSENGYSLTNISAVDMFPFTGHVECVVLMSRNKE